MIAGASYFLELLFKWLSIFAAPFRNFELLWITIPIYLSWAFTEFYQEKKGTSFGNAISNGFVPVWVGIDWSKTTYVMLQTKAIKMNSVFITKMIFAALLLMYGLAVMIMGVNTKKMTHFVGRIRVVTYVCIMCTPIFYGVIPLDFSVLFSIILFFPLFYYFIELVDYVVPDPKAYKEDEELDKPKDTLSDSPFSSSNDPFNSISNNTPGKGGNALRPNNNQQPRYNPFEQRRF